MKHQSPQKHQPTPQQLPPSRRREIARRKRKRRRQIRRISLLLVLAVLFLLLATRGVSCVRQTLSQHSESKSSHSFLSGNDNKKKTVKPGSLSLIAVGDNLMHNTLLTDAATSDGYDFTPFYSEIKPYVQAADIAVINQESPLGKGKAEGYPSFNTPQSCGDALVDAGFDVISQANNHIMDSTSSAVYDTMDYWDSQAKNGVMHWGEEYHQTPNEEQEDLAEFLTENGATLIIGAHPHVCEQADWVESENGNRAFCIYSLGNFISGQNKAETIVEGMLQVTLTRDETGTVTVENPGVMPLVCTSSKFRSYRVIPLDDYTQAMAKKHTLAGRCDVSPSNLNSIAKDAYGKYLIAKTIPKTYDTTYAEKSSKVSES